MAKYKLTKVYVVEAASKAEAMTTLSQASDPLEYLEYEGIKELASEGGWKQGFKRQLSGK